MKKFLLPILAAVSAMTLVAGCAWELGGGSKITTVQPTVGQQLVDLQKAKDAGALTDAEYQAQKEKVLGSK